ncbi:hypothetical protein ACQ4WX_19155 [Streptomyces lasalocidi]
MRQLCKKAATGPAAAALICAGALLSAPAAAAAGHAPATFSADPLATWQTDGIVWSLAYARGVVYAAGSFDTVRPPGAAAGTRQVQRHNFAAFDAATGKLLPCALSFTSGAEPVHDRHGTGHEALPDGQVLYVGGSFGRVGSTGVANAVAVNTADCTLRKDFRPAVNATVRAIDTTDRGVYLGGDFDTVDGRSRKRVAAFTHGGSLLPFKADVDLPVRALSAVPAQREILVGGDFASVNGQAGPRPGRAGHHLRGDAPHLSRLAARPLRWSSRSHRTAPTSTSAPKEPGAASSTDVSRPGSRTAR